MSSNDINITPITDENTPEFGTVLATGEEAAAAHPFPVNLPGAKSPTLMWAHEYDVEPQALQQLRNIAALEWVHGVRVMPDVHLGKGATVGSVIAMRDALSPSAVGVDIGCGVGAVKTNLTLTDLPDDIHSLRTAIEKAIPVGFNSHDRSVNVSRLNISRKMGLGLDRSFDSFWGDFTSLDRGVADLHGRALAQIGTLGGGNHFLELCVDDNEDIWLTLHSGSRNIGKSLAEIHIKTAKTLAHNLDLPDKDLAVFLSGTPEMEAYRRDLDWAQEYAARNRAVMLALFSDAVRTWFGGLTDAKDVKFAEPISAHHNYVMTEHIDGLDLIVTRKGAIRAGNGDLALIPGSMGTGSYVVRGLGNPESFYSASHGAGRKMSRSAAKKNFTVDDLIAQTAGIECRKDQGVVDEIPGAYKSIDSVIEAQSDLVSVEARLHTLLCVKG
jgi:tRNA-splicing ligase RtcB